MTKNVIAKASEIAELSPDEKLLALLVGALRFALDQSRGLHPSTCLHDGVDFVSAAKKFGLDIKPPI